MALTIGAIALIAALIFLIYYGYSVGIRRGIRPGEENRQKCSLCLQSFDRSNLIERQVSDNKVFYFCESCVESLYTEVQQRDRRDAKQL